MLEADGEADKYTSPFYTACQSASIMPIFILSLSFQVLDCGLPLFCSAMFRR